MTQKFEMADRFNPSAVEQALYQHWEESGYFKPSENEMRRAIALRFHLRT